MIMKPKFRRNASKDTYFTAYKYCLSLKKMWKIKTLRYGIIIGTYHKRKAAEAPIIAIARR